MIIIIITDVIFGSDASLTIETGGYYFYFSSYLVVRHFVFTAIPGCGVTAMTIRPPLCSSSRDGCI